jgi:hypothetical protein
LDNTVITLMGSGTTTADLITMVDIQDTTVLPEVLVSTVIDITDLACPTALMAMVLGLIIMALWDLTTVVLIISQYFIDLFNPERNGPRHTIKWIR